MKKLLIPFLLLPLAWMPVQAGEWPALPKRDSFLSEIASLKERFGHHKRFEPVLEVECLAALSFFPELSETAIRFRFGNTSSTMESRPVLRSVIFPGAFRSYLIVIRKPGHSRTGLDWPDLSFSALVGWIGHELSHIVYYENKTTAGMIATGIKYLFPGWRRRCERFTDFVTIRHSLGPALYEGVDYTVNRSAATKKYKDRLNRFYLQAEEIRTLDRQQHRYELDFHQTRFRLQQPEATIP